MTRHVAPPSIEWKILPGFPSEFIAMTDMPFIDDPHATDVFADSASGFFLLNGNLRITLETARVNHISSPGPVNLVVIARLVMPASAAENLARSILEFFEGQRNQPAQPLQAKSSLN
jgi:hypothetical protein